MKVTRKDISNILPLSEIDKIVAETYDYKYGYFVFVVDGGKTEISVKFWDEHIFNFLRCTASEFIKNEKERRKFENMLNQYMFDNQVKVGYSSETEKELIEFGEKYWKHNGNLYSKHWRTIVYKPNVLALDVELYWVGDETKINKLLKKQNKK